MAYEPTLAATISPSPQVQVNFDSVPAGAAFARVEKTFDGITLSVRDGLYAYASGGLTLTDYEAPIGTNVSYRAEMFDGANISLGYTGSTTTILYGEGGWAYVSDPYSPLDVVQVQQADSFADSLGKQRAGQSYVVSGRVVTLYGEDGLLENVKLDCYTPTVELTDKLRSVLSAGFLLVRTMPPVALPRLLYVFVGRRNEIGVDIRRGGEFTRWDLSGDEQSPTDIGIALPVAPWQTYMDAFATWQQMIDAYPTWLDAMKNPPGV